MHQTPETKEEYSAKIPALQVLSNLGWDYLSPADCLEKRGSHREVILKDELVAALQTRRFGWGGEDHALSGGAIEQILRELSPTGLQEGLITANERLYEKLILGVTVKEFIGGKAVHPTISVIDWDNPENNRFHVTEEMAVSSASGTHKRIPDLVCFVNGIPLVVMEAKRPDSGNPRASMIDEGISQSIRNQKNDEIPHLFCYAQLLLAISNTEGRYGTTRTPAKFWARWREEELDEKWFHGVKNRPISVEVRNAIFADRPAAMGRYFETLWSKPVLPTEQDRLLVSLLSKDRLLELLRYFILFDKRVGKIVARYQQVFGIKAMLGRVKQLDRHGARQGGVIWHTTGSGKSFTMVFLSQALLLEPELRECRIILVTDRVDLEKQLSKVFLSGGAFGSVVATRKEGERAKARTGRDLAQRIGKGTDRILFTIIDKFNTASKLPECYNPSDKLIVLVDEGHRSHGGETHQRMRNALPNAAYIAFTGTPLLKDDKTQNKFGPIIHAYTMQRAVEDGTVTPLLYEERRPELEVNETAIDNWFDRITTSLLEQQKTDLKKKFATKGAVYGAEERIRLIAWDMATHYSENIKALSMGLKAQLATDSKLSAIRYKKFLDETGLVTSAVVISPPDTREGHMAVDEAVLPEVQQWFKETVGNVSRAESYEREVIEGFGTDEGVDILIVVDKLLTGFDEPRNTVLYIDKPLKDHNLLQAIARVNRLHEAKEFGLLIDYRGILKELDTTLKQYQDLQQRTQGGFDVDDIDGLYRQVGTEYKKLPLFHKRLRAIFRDVRNEQDLEQFRQVLIPKVREEEDGSHVDLNQKVREDFYEALTAYGLCLKVALSSRSFYTDGSFSEEEIARYKKDFRFFANLRKIAGHDAQETVDYAAYAESIRDLVDRHVVGESVIGYGGVLDVGGMGKEGDPENWSEEKTRNETDIIRTRVRKTIEQNLGDDPYARKYFSQLLREAIREAEKLFDHPLKQYMLFKAFEDKVNARDISDMPEALKESAAAKAYFGTFRLVLGEEGGTGGGPEEQQPFVEKAMEMDTIVRNQRAEHSLNPQSMESSIRLELLPRLFELVGVEKAKEIIDHVIHITRVQNVRGER